LSPGDGTRRASCNRLRPSALSRSVRNFSMTSSPAVSVTLGRLIGVILLSVALGMMLITTLEEWLRGRSFIWWLLLAVLFVVAVGANAAAVTKRIS
jgi:sterol desaturase/sphingolipid hydroxylase (fatty acid hydroxylase superfamily)